MEKVVRVFFSILFVALVLGGCIYMHVECFNGNIGACFLISN